MIVAGRGDPIQAVFIVLIAAAIMFVVDLLTWWYHRTVVVGRVARDFEDSRPIALEAELVSQDGRDPRRVAQGEHDDGDRSGDVVELPPLLQRPSVDVVALPGVIRWSPTRKKEIALRLLRGERPEAIAREVAVPLFKLEEWRNQAL